MKKGITVLFILISIFVLNNSSFGQGSGKIIYSTILESENFKELEGVLYFEGDRSFFYIRNDEFHETTTNEDIENQPDGAQAIAEPLLNFAPPMDSLIHQVYIDRGSEIIKSKRTIFKNGKYVPCIVLEPTHAFEWKITSESKEIGSYTALKARSAFRGRNYTAWFVPDIDVNAGPWKFHGLPGLILEVVDEEKGVQFLFSSWENSYKRKVSLKPPVEEKTLTIEEFAHYNDPERIAEEFLNWLTKKLPAGANLVNSGNISTTVNKTGIEREY